MKLICVFFFCFASLFSDPILLEGIRLLPEGQAIDEALASSEPIDIQVDCDTKRMRSCLEPYLNVEITEEILQKIEETIREEFAAEDNALMDVYIPEQKLSASGFLKGRITVVLVPAELGKIDVVGNRWFSASSISNALGLAEKATVTESDLLNAACCINRNPFIHTDLLLSAGEYKGTTDVEVLVQDRFPARFYAGTDNTGNSFSGNNRLFTGVNVSIGLHALFTYQFTTAYSFPEFLSHFGNLTLLIPWNRYCPHQLVFYGGYATLHPEITSFESEGRNIQASMRHRIPFLPLYTPFQHQFDWGVDYKQTNSALFFLGGQPNGSLLRVLVNQKRADLFQFYLGYHLSDAWDKSNLTFAGDLFFSPFIFLPHQTTADYNALRPRADIRYFYTKVALGGKYPLPMQCSWVGFFRSQLASGALLPSEQYALGGYDTVRGYQESVYLADNALIGNFEFHTPSFSCIPKRLDQCYFLVFLDAAYGHNWHATPSYPKDAWLLGSGAGVRYEIAPYLTARFDYGFRIHNTTFGNAQLGRFHFSVIAGY